MVSMPPPFPAADMPAPFPNEGDAKPAAGRARDWTVLLYAADGSEQKVEVKNAFAPEWRHGKLVFTDSEGAVTASFAENDIKSYTATDES